MRNDIKIKTEAVKRGFTLVELLVVVAIIATLGTIAIKNVNEYLKKADETAARASVRSLSEAVTSYYTEHKKFPTTLTQLVEGTDDNPPIVEGGEGALIDPWDNEYRLEKKGKRFVIISDGPDGQPGTDDDIRSDKAAKTKK